MNTHPETTKKSLQETASNELLWAAYGQQLRPTATKIAHTSSVNSSKELYDKKCVDRNNEDRCQF